MKCRKQIANALRIMLMVHSQASGVRPQGVPTARSLSVVTSSERVTRPWYTHPSHQTMQTQGTPPRCDENEAAAMLCRSARSFWRVGHVELFARRGETELADFLWHVFCRDFPHLDLAQNRLDEAIVAFFEEFVKRQAELVAEWLRVGYVHGNMNSDNCLLCSQTLDFGPFAFMEAYDPVYQPFTSDKKGPWQKLTRRFSKWFLFRFDGCFCFLDRLDIAELHTTAPVQYMFWYIYIYIILYFCFTCRIFFIRIILFKSAVRSLCLQLSSWCSFCQCPSFGSKSSLCSSNWRPRRLRTAIETDCSHWATDFVYWCCLLLALRSNEFCFDSCQVYQLVNYDGV